MENLRYEYKMIADRTLLPDVLSIIRQHRAMFRLQYGNRIVNNIYFDSPSLKSYNDHINGSAHREKKRIRWYGNPTSVIEKPVLERKIKRGTVGEKLSETLKPLALDNSGPWPIPGKALLESKTNADAIHWQLRSTVPILALRYERYYFTSADNRYRITVDANLEYFGLLTAAEQTRSVSNSPVIIEIKYNKIHADHAMDITNGLPFRIDRFSKYIFALHGLKINI
jgi:VTC domain